ncbi:MAG: insulinase family protein, partial [Candidatus Eremiobacteraeota bacterium]|nr:insulinase family protein [Candidatus Eremiobacteraeota bacterium]
FKVGLLEESKGTWGLRGMILHLMLAHLRKPGDDGKTPEEKGVIITGNISPDYMDINFTGRGEQMESIFKLISQLFITSWISEADFNMIKNEMLVARRGGSGPYYDIMTLFRKFFYRYYPYREPQSDYYNAISSVSREKLCNFMKKYYVPDRAVVSVIFPGEVTGVKKMAKKYLGDISPGESGLIDIPWEPVKQEREIRLNAYSNLGYVIIGFPAPSADSMDRPVMEIIQAYLGEGFSSRLFVELREKRGLVYTPGCTYPTLTGPSYIIMFAPTTPGKVRKVRNIMLDIVDDLKTRGIPPEHLRLCRSILKGKFLISTDDIMEKARVYGCAEVCGLGYQVEKNMPEKYDRVRSEDVMRVARKYFRNHTIILINPGGFYIE